FGDDYVADVPRTYDRKVKNAQEAHEAIRPAGESFRSLEEATSQLSGDEYAVYDLIWKRTIASQMVDAKLTSDRVRLLATLSDLPGRPGATEVGLSANGLRIEFAGFRRAYVEGSDDPESELADQERLLPPLTEGSTATVSLADAKGHDTKPPDRFSEATLIKKLEDLGIGRPSTYASVMKTIDRRGYVWKKGKALVPAFKAFAVVNLLSTYFADLVDYQFTAAMEDSLDAIASGDRELEPWLKSFYFGDASAPTEFAKRGLHAMVTEQLDFDYAAINSLPLGTAPDGEAVSVRSGRYGPYLVHGERRVSIPEATEPDSLTVTRALELLDAPSGDRELGTDPATGLAVYLKAGRYGPYVQLGELVDGTKPKTASLFSTMTLETITFEDAQKLLSLPREIGAHPENQEMIFATNGRYGPYVMWGKDSRSLESEDEIFSVDLDKALHLLAQPKLRGRRAAAGPLRELGPDPITGKEVVVKTGKFGPYVTDGEVNATLRIGDTPETVTIDRACELLAERRNADPTARRAPAKKAAKKAVKKAPAKKAAAKKAPANKAGVKKATATKKATGGTGRGAKGQGADQSATNADLISRLSGE
ncbi:MAG: DNA topoisomerase I, partial [Actinobacteria bacterium]|nr:DNA topoisomerase I [Actinomycetota bacterium]